ncbi:MAG TPA: trypsin-like peptidase domain-containing protein [Candidatus Acidoferrales bacterium]|nr:trypsin-like peptidase domain-containing protein [Candidatus Acidoferrales bacterium]
MRSVLLCFCAIGFVGSLSICAAPVSANTLTITSVPVGAEVEMDGLVVGKTPYSTEMPGGYFHKTHMRFSTRLEHAIVIRLSLDGYASQEMTITQGPFVWRGGYSGKPDGDYWLLKADHFEVTLDPVSKIFTGQPEISSMKNDSSLPDAALSPEAIVRQSDPAIVRVEGDKGRGTGFFVTSTGVIATNRHVIEGQSQIYVISRTFHKLAAKVVYIDSDKDLALLKVDGAGFPHLALAALDAVNKGEAVVAIGDPGGGMPDTITRGVVSGIGAYRVAGNGTWIQTDATINPGNSGGPLLDPQGRVVGITAESRARNDAGQPVSGLNFALSAQNLIEVLRRFYPPTEKSAATMQGAGSATVNVLSDPSGADIYVDGEFVGDTPSVLHLSAGGHSIKIQAAGKQAWERKMDVLKGSKLTLNPTLEPQS